MIPARRPLTHVPTDQKFNYVIHWVLYNCIEINTFELDQRLHSSSILSLVLVKMVYIPTLKPLGAINTVDESDPRYIAHLDKEIQLEDGARLRLNVYLPRTGGPKWPVLMTATPYGKDV